MKAASLTAHHTVDELELAYRHAERPIERSRWHILWLKSKGKPIPELMELTGYSRTTISTLIRSYNDHGQAGVLDQRQFNKSEPALNEERRAILFQALQQPPESHGIWTSRRVQTYIRETFGIEITEPCAWGYLRRLGFTVQVPRPTHIQAASPEERQVFTKKLKRR